MKIEKDKRKILQIKKKYEKKILILPNVVGLGVGIKETGGISTGRAALKIYVKQKIPKDELLKEQLIPAKLEGIETDVEEIGRVKAL